eukprot:scaffold65_cov233-Pinguiococcus_pyrenoidosus.AAC.3
MRMRQCRSLGILIRRRILASGRCSERHQTLGGDRRKWTNKAKSKIRKIQKLDFQSFENLKGQKQLKTRFPISSSFSCHKLFSPFVSSFSTDPSAFPALCSPWVCSPGVQFSMGDRQGNGGQSAAESLVAGGGASFMPEFFAQVDEVKAVIEQIKSATVRVGELNQEAMLATAPEKEAALSNELKPLVRRTNEAAAGAKSKLQVGLLSASVGILPSGHFPTTSFSSVCCGIVDEKRCRRSASV